MTEKKHLPNPISYNRMTQILHDAIMIYECELEDQGYENPEDIHRIVLNELSMTEDEYLAVMGREYKW